MKTSILSLATSIALCTTATDAPAQTWALELDAEASVDFPHHAVMNTDTTVTMEAWLRIDGPLEPGMEGGFLRYAGSAEHKELFVTSDLRIRWLYAGHPWAHSGPCRETAPGTFPDDGQWHHVAFVEHPDRSWEVYLDGLPIQSGDTTGCCWLTCDVINASTETRILGMPGLQFRSLRISEVDRYFGPFTPDEYWVSDADTAMLLPFEEGAGTTVFDLGPAMQLGLVNGPHTWIDLTAECSSENYCVGAPNSSGPGATLTSSGSTSVSQNSLTLVATGAAPHSPGLFVYSSSAAEVPFGDGYRCVGTSLGDVLRLSPTTITNENGVSMRDLDFTAPPLDAGAGQITPGSTWRFQFWYRDVGQSGSGFNSTDGLRIRFCH